MFPPLAEEANIYLESYEKQTALHPAPFPLLLVLLLLKRLTLLKLVFPILNSKRNYLVFPESTIIYPQSAV
jgi:hypothetical protein